MNLDRYEDAIRCYRKEGDEQGIARIYARMKEFEKALAIWTKLGRDREVSRVLKKWKKQKAAKMPLKLF